MASRRAVLVVPNVAAVGPRTTDGLAWCLAQVLQDQGFAVEIMALATGRRSACDWHSVVDPSGMTITRVRPGPVLVPRFAMWQALRARGPFDVVWVSPVAVVGQPAVMAAKEWGVPVIAHVAGSDVLGDVFAGESAPFVTWTLQSADRVTAATSQMARVVAAMRSDRDVAVWPETISIDTNYQRSDAESQWGMAPTGLRIGVLGATGPDRGLGETLTAFSLLNRIRPDARLILSGDFPSDVREQIGEWKAWDQGAESRMQAVPPIDGTDLPLWLSALDQLWLPYDQASTLTPLYAGMAAGVPIVATALPPVMDALGDGVTGRIVPVGDAMAMADAALQLSNDPKAAQAMGALARQRVPADVTIAALGERVAACLQAVGLV